MNDLDAIANENRSQRESMRATTYLATGGGCGRSDDDPLTVPYCSPICRAEAEGAEVDGKPYVLEFRDDSRYEFEETCAACGAVIPASA